MRKIVTTNESNELPRNTTFSEGSSIESKVLALVENNSPKVLFVASLEDVPSGTPADTLIVVV